MMDQIPPADSHRGPVAPVFAWVERLTGGTIISKSLQERWRPQWGLVIRTPKGDLNLWLRSYRDPGLDTLEGSKARLQCEAGVLKALQDTGVRAPKFYGYEPQLHWILMENLRGTEMLTEESNAARRAGLFRQYMDNLYAMHRLDPKHLDLPVSLPRPTTPEEARFGIAFKTQLARYNAVPRAEPQPILELALWWLRTHAPDDPGEPRLCFGDAGANQFKFEGDTLTGLFDWELTRLGSPMMDLGNIRHRAMFYPIGDMVPHIRYYEELSGQPLDLKALHFHTLMSSLYGRLAYTEKLAKPDPWALDQIAVTSFEGIGRFSIMETLLDAYGLAADLPQPPTARENEWQKYYDLVVGHVSGPLQKAVASDSHGPFWIKSAQAAAKVLARHNEIGRDLENDDLAGLTTILGTRPASVREGMAALEKMILADPRPKLREILLFLHQYQGRQNLILEPVHAAMGSANGERIARFGAVEEI